MTQVTGCFRMLSGERAGAVTREQDAVLTKAAALMGRTSAVLAALHVMATSDVVVACVESSASLVDGVSIECSDEARLVRAPCYAFGPCMWILLESHVTRIGETSAATVPVHVTVSVTETHGEVRIGPARTSITAPWHSRNDDPALSTHTVDFDAAILALQRSGFSVEFFANAKRQRLTILRWQRRRSSQEP
jgi:hypothetical protein